MEHEFRQIVRQDGVAFYESRLFNDNEITPETLRAMQSRIAPAASLILPGIPLDVVAFGCTSAAMELGEDTVFAELRKARPDARYPKTGRASGRESGWQYGLIWGGG